MQNPAHRLVVLLTAIAVLSGTCGAVRADEQPIVIRENAILQRMALGAGGKLLATVGVTHDGKGFNSTVKIRDAQTGKLIRTFDEEKESHLEIAFSSEYLAIAVNGRAHDREKPLHEIRLVNPESGKVEHKIDNTTLPAGKHWTTVAFSPDGKRLAAGGVDNAPFVKLWHIEKNRLLGNAEVEGLPAFAGSLAFYDGGRSLAVGCDDGRVRLLRNLSGEIVGTLDLAVDPRFIVHRNIAASPDGKTLVTAGADNTVQLWNLAERKPTMALAGHTSQLTAVAFSSDGKRIATGTWDREVFVWDAESGERKQNIAVETDITSGLAFSADSKTLIVCAGAGRDVGGEVQTSGELRLVRLE